MKIDSSLVPRSSRHEGIRTALCRFMLTATKEKKQQVFMGLIDVDIAVKYVLVSTACSRGSLSTAYVLCTAENKFVLLCLMLVWDIDFGSKFMMFRDWTVYDDNEFIAC
ncbi:hypothetical protein Tco_1401022 [Tanacetum coccineum]